MARKGENIRKRKDGRWEARYIKGRNPNGSIRYGYVYASKYSEVKEKRNIAIRNTELTKEPGPVLSSNPSFNELLLEWKREVHHRVRSSSYFFYEVITDHHLAPYFGNYTIMQLSNDLVQEFIRYKIEENLSCTYIHSIMIVFQNILKLARKKNDLQIPLLYFQIPKARQKSLEIFTFQEWKDLEYYLSWQQDDFSFGLRLCMYTGLRIGELSGLKWSDIDASTGQLSVKRTIYRMKNPDFGEISNVTKTIICVGPPKTRSSIREIPIPLFLLKESELYRKSDEDFILTGTINCMEPRNIQKRYKRLLEKCKLRYLNFHSLRHSFATIGIQKGFDYRTLAEILGHTSVNTTLNIYVHSNMERKRQCMELLEP